MSDPLLQSQDDLYARLLADDYLADVAVLKQRDGVTASDITLKLATLNTRGGKLGALAIVLMPELEPKDANVQPPQSDLLIAVQVIESPLLNFGAQGTQKTAEQIGARVRRILHHFYDGSQGTWYLHRDEPIDVPKGQVSRGVMFRRHHQDEPLNKVVAPVIADAGGALPYTVTLTTTTSGAAILYTLDGTYPRAAAAGTFTYTVPFTVATALSVRAIATKADHSQSDISETAFS